jgi:hypothetical protein
MGDTAPGSNPGRVKRDLAQPARVSLVIDWLEELYDKRVHPWFRPEFVHPRDFERAVTPPLAIRRSGGRRIG